MSITSLNYAPSESPTHGVVFLHGWGANAEDLASLAPALALPHLQFLFPNAPHPHPYNPQGRMWYDLNTQAHLKTTRQELKQWVQALPESIGLPLDHIILGGFSQGGAMTLDVGSELPLAGLLCLSGYLHPNLPLETAQNKPILLIHGRKDPVVPIRMAQRAHAQLKKANLTVDYHELEMAHEITPQALKLIQEFLTKVCHS